MVLFPSTVALVLTILGHHVTPANSCPFIGSSEGIPQDDMHRHLRRRTSSLDDREKQKNFIEKHKEELYRKLHAPVTRTSSVDDREKQKNYIQTHEKNLHQKQHDPVTRISSLDEREKQKDFIQEHKEELYRKLHTPVTRTSSVDDREEQKNYIKKHEKNLHRKVMGPVTPTPVPPPTLPAPVPSAPVTPTPLPTVLGDHIPGCISTDIYDSIISAVADHGNGLANNAEKAHFFGGIVRLAAHDFMDIDIHEGNGGSDGCIDFTNGENAGLEDLWCDGCFLTNLYEETYLPLGVSKADFWVAIANGAIKATSRNQSLDLPFQWGRNDHDNCTPETVGTHRLPASTGCQQVQDTFITRMGLSWRDAVALMGAHTLGRASLDASGHDGHWMDDLQQATVFDKHYYDELIRRSWFPRVNDAGKQEWSWGGQQRGAMFLNTDICLFFDIQDGDSHSCCTDTSGDCRGRFQDSQCPSAESIRPEAHAAVIDFLDNRNDNDNSNFYTAYSSAWELATENGHVGTLKPVGDANSCIVTGPTPPPAPVTPAPVPPPTLPAPVTPAPVTPTPLPTVLGDHIPGCISTDIYDSIISAVADHGNGLANNAEKAHFFGGIVRLAAHDFMDIDIHEGNGGSDGCIDFTNGENAGLEDLWCDGCFLTDLYEETYLPLGVSKADFWVAIANGAIKATSRNQSLDLPFQWGRNDHDNCTPETVGTHRLPASTGCQQVQDTFITRMGLSWRDAVALMGAHTLGRASLDASGHDGHWMDDLQQATVFDKHYYDELIRRSWFPRVNDAGKQEWSWGGQQRGAMFLNTDICLFFDIQDGDSHSCCTDTSGDCRGRFQDSQCPSAESIRPEAHAAVIDFLDNRNDNDNSNFYTAYSSAWELATENGHVGTLKPVGDANSCIVTGPTPPPAPVTPAPVPPPTLPAPVTPAPVTPTPLPTVLGDHIPGCISTDIYDSIISAVADHGNGLANNAEKAHFFGGIVRLAAHDFMDIDIHEGNGGSDGCIDFTNGENAGLEDLWCDGCFLTNLYEETYLPLGVSKADFWVAIANGAIKATSRNQSLDLPFQWGRNDHDNCTPETVGTHRLPASTGCQQVQDTFITRMGLSWRDAVALMGAHTLGRASLDASGHDGHWMDDLQQATVFDKHYYDELIRRSWFPRVNDAGKQEWSWGGQQRGAMFLNTDICLFFDIQDGDSHSCCTDTSGDCRGRFQDSQCPSAESIRPEAHAAVIDFLDNRNDNDNSNFYTAYSSAWELATENGHVGTLKPVGDANSCIVTGPTPPPAPVTPAPVPPPTLPAPVTPAPVTPTPLPTVLGDHIPGCISTDIYDSIISAVADHGNGLANNAEKAHFFGGIVRLAAHDFMDIDIHEGNGGSDGCIDFTNGENAGLEDLWCDGCFLTNLYEETYLPLGVSKADFWVAIANGAIKATSRNQSLDLPFQWGRNDHDNCTPETVGTHRLPASTGCQQVQDTFITRMGLSWRDAVALMGAHTLGRASLDASGHDGHWMDDLQQATVFDKHYYDELIRRSWFPRVNDAGKQEWSWGGQQRGAMFLNTDICLFFDIQDGDSHSCCTDTSGDCRGRFQDSQCPSAESIRPEAHAAVIDFLDNRNDNDNSNFYTAYSSAWELATENGHVGTLKPVGDANSCIVTGPTPPPAPVTPAPVPPPTLPAPVTPAPVTPTPLPTVLGDHIPGCISTDIYDSIISAVADHGNGLANNAEKAHFFGGIVRLAAHDFMDIDIHEGNGGSDGCIDFTNGENAGLEDLWCDGCFLTDLYEETYLPLGVSKADFWVAIANGAIKATSRNQSLDLPFQWGRNDHDNCTPETVGTHRLPASTGCQQVQDTFITRMGLSWRDAVALMGAHTLGRASLDASGHDGHWMDDLQQATVFDKHYYDELIRRSWFPRVNDAGKQEWSWGGQQRGAMFLNTDICLFFDIQDGDSHSCCTDTSGDCRGRFQDSQCPSAESIRPEAHAAVIDFLDNRNDNDNSNFYTAYSSAWELATENGHVGTLKPVGDANSCIVTGPTPPPAPVTPAPVPPPTLPAPVTPAPVPTATTCEDDVEFFDKMLNLRTCDSNWFRKDFKKRCEKYGQDHCPATCGLCEII